MGKRKRGSDDDDDFQLSDHDDDYNDDEDFESTMKSADVVVDELDDEVEEVEEPPKKKAKTTTTKAKVTLTKKASTKSASTKEKTTKKKATTTKSASTKKNAKKDLTIKDEPTARKAVHEFMLRNNRPYSVQGLVDNMGGQVKKAMAQKCVDKLVSSGKVTLKENKKAKVYFVNQDDLPVLSEDELKKLDEKIKKKTLESQELKVEIVNLTKNKAELQKAMTDEELADSVKQLEEEVERKKTRLEKLTNAGAVLADPEDKKKAMTAMNRYLNAWKDRKRKFMDAVDKLCEMAVDEKPKFFIEETLGLETDEMLGISVDSLGKLE